MGHGLPQEEAWTVYRRAHLQYWDGTKLSTLKELKRIGVYTDILQGEALD